MTSPRDRWGRFLPGHSGNPKGKAPKFNSTTGRKASLKRWYIEMQDGPAEEPTAAVLENAPNVGEFSAAPEPEPEAPQMSRIEDAHVIVFGDGSLIANPFKQTSRPSLAGWMGKWPRA